MVEPDGEDAAIAGVGALAGPGVGVRPSLKALAIEEAFHFAYVIFSFTWFHEGL